MLLEMRKSMPWWALLIILAGIILQGTYASSLNRLYYSRFAPFFDSMAYTNQLAETLIEAKRHGAMAGFKVASDSRTVTLPWLVAAILAPVVPVSRLVGVWMQEVWMALLAFSVLAYWRLYRGVSLPLALLWTVPPVSFAAVYRHNGGISDFRMDLSLYIFFSISAVWYLASRESTARLPWILSGAGILLCCLNRATAPAYLGVALGPVLVARWFAEPDRRRWLVGRVAAYWLPAAAAGVLPTVLNWRFVHYYYFVWGADPNAGLSLSQSSEHFKLAGFSMGFYLAAACGVLVVTWLVQNRRRLIPPSGANPAVRPVLDWATVWIACAPALLLTVKGAGLNPFVSMPSVFCALLFCMAPFRERPAPGLPVWGATVLAVLACMFQARQGYLDHTDGFGGARPTMAPLKRGIELIESDSKRRGKTKVQFLTAHLGDYQASGLRNVLFFEFGAVPVEGGLQLPDGVWLGAFQEDRFSPAVPVSWNRLPGADDAAKIRGLVAIAAAEVDYFFLPDDRTIGWLEQHRSFNFINLKMRDLKRELFATNGWRQVGEPLQITNDEIVELFANERR